MYEDFLKKIPLFSQLEWDDLNRLCRMVEEVRLPAGQQLFAEGSPGDRVYVLKEGRIEVVKNAGDRDVLLAAHDEPGVVIGEMSLIEQAPRMASVRASTDTFMLAIHHEQLEQLLNQSPSAARTMLNTIIHRWRNTEAMLRQNEKMAQLGTLTAGVAHELNNPAAAVKRGAEQLLELLNQFGHWQAQRSILTLAADQEAIMTELEKRVQACALRPTELDTLTRSDREYDIEEWLEDHGVEDAWEIAPHLVSLNYTDSELDTLAHSFTDEQLAVVTRWLSAAYTSRSLLAEIGQGAGRISEIVKALKSYSYLDQAPVQEVDIHEVLDNTLIIMRNKLKQGITVRREYADDLPPINGYGSELNQVWTNIIHNAIDAMDDEGEIVIHTRRDDNQVIVEISDNGPGIPPEIQTRIFDPFFTTKGPGKGTGLGLSISDNIVRQKHRGNIVIDSRPGRTTFRVQLPINFEER